MLSVLFNSLELYFCTHSSNTRKLRAASKESTELSHNYSARHMFIVIPKKKNVARIVSFSTQGKLHKIEFQLKQDIFQFVY